MAHTVDRSEILSQRLAHKDERPNISSQRTARTVDRPKILSHRLAHTVEMPEVLSNGMAYSIDRPETLSQGVALSMDRPILPYQGVAHTLVRLDPASQEMACTEMMRLASAVITPSRSKVQTLEMMESGGGLGSLEVLPQEVRNRIFSFLPLPHLLNLRQGGAHQFKRACLTRYWRLADAKVTEITVAFIFH